MLELHAKDRLNLRFLSVLDSYILFTSMHKRESHIHLSQ